VIRKKVTKILKEGGKVGAEIDAYLCPQRCWQSAVSLSSTDHLFPVHRVTEHLNLEPLLVVVFEVVGEVDRLTEDAVDAVVDRLKVGSDARRAVAAAVEAVHAGAKGALLRLEVPRTGVHV